MPSGNLDEPVTATSPRAVPPRAFRLPSDYYCAPLTEVRPIFPKWVPMGCGAASAVLLVLLFAGGALVTGPRLANFMDFFLGTSLAEVRKMFAPDIPAAQKQAFEDEVKRLREELRNDRVSVQNLQPFLKAMQSAIADKKVTAEELDRLTKAAHEVVVTAKRQPVTGNR